jgi:DHA2 family multidrug resistance protein
MPVAGAIVGKFQARYIIGFDWLVLSVGMYYSTQHLDLDISFGTASLLRVLQVFGLAFLFVPINIVAFVGVPADKSNSVAGLVNFMRNIGSSIGTSMVATLIARRAQFHQVPLVAHTSPGQPTFAQSVEALAGHLGASGLDAVQATSQAYARMYQAVIGQATTLAYIDTFWVLCIGAAIMFLLSFVLKRNNPGAGGEVAVG